MIVLATAATQVLFPVYSNLVATDDGRAVYFNAPGALFVAKLARAGVSVTSVSGLGPFMDVDGAGAVVAFGDYRSKRCTGCCSTCALAADCAGSFHIDGPGVSLSGPASNMVRMDNSAKYAWIQARCCFPHAGTWPACADMSGLYDISDGKNARPAAANAQSLSLANSSYGRRAITVAGRALVFRGGQLEWLDDSGEHPIRHVSSAYEAVTDSAGANVAYVETKIGKLHWIAATDRGVWIDEDLGLTGSAPAIAADGSFLAFLTVDGTLQIYRRATREVRSMSADAYVTFAVGGTTIFGVTTTGQLMRTYPTTGEKVLVLPPMPEISSVYTRAMLLTSCGLVCYGQDEIGYQLTGGMILLFAGEHFTQPGWRIRVGGADLAPVILSDKAAYIQVPSSTPQNASTLDLYNANYPMHSSFSVRMYSNFVAACFGSLHEKFDRLVSTDDPAVSGEVVHMFLTGLRGTQPVPDGVPNPSEPLIPVANPPSINPNAASVLFFGLAPGLIGIQQLDLKVLAPFENEYVLGGAGCTLPAITRR